MATNIIVRKFPNGLSRITIPGKGLIGFIHHKPGEEPRFEISGYQGTLTFEEVGEIFRLMQGKSDVHRT